MRAKRSDFQAWLGSCGAPALAILLAAAPATAEEGKPGKRSAETASLPLRVLPATPQLVETGKTAFLKECALCHGVSGDGKGPAAAKFPAPPRDFSEGVFLFVSTWERIPTDEDLFRTITRGLPGTPMRGYADLPEKTRWGLVHYVKSLSKKPLVVPPPSPPPSFGSPGKGVIEVPPEPPDTEEARARARSHFAESCARCHGTEGRGDGKEVMTDTRGLPIRPRDLTEGVFKGGSEPEDIYRRIVAGIPGSPMPQHAYLHGDDGWALTRFVLSLSRK